VAIASPTYVNLWPYSLHNKTKPDHVSEVPALNSTSYDDDSTTFLYELMSLIGTR
jgi:hypothetical protein